VGEEDEGETADDRRGEDVDILEQPDVLDDTARLNHM